VESGLDPQPDFRVSPAISGFCRGASRREGHGVSPIALPHFLRILPNAIRRDFRDVLVGIWLASSHD
jgi:hypothetical protein